MRQWGIVLTALYAVIVVGMLIPGAAYLSAPAEKSGYEGVPKATQEILSEPIVWVVVATLILSQALLLFLSVDTSQKRLKPQVHIGLSCAVAALLTTFLIYAGINSFGVGISGDKFITRSSGWIETQRDVLEIWGVLWLAWSVIFYLYLRNKSELVRRIVTWLLRGSVLELLVAVPCHVLVRRKQECCAPMVTSFGIATGIAIMLLAFGPSVLFLYKKRLDAYVVREVK